MHFVHLTDRDSLGPIRKSGIRMGNGRCGKGVYAMPLIHYPRWWYADETERTGGVLSDPVSSVDAWKKVLFGWELRGNRPVAVIFSVPDDAWPVEVYLKLTAAEAGPLLGEIARTDHCGVTLEASSLEWVESCAREGFASTLGCRADGPRSLGRLLRQYLSVRGQFAKAIDDSLEVLITRPVPPRYISKVIALSQRNEKARERRDRSRVADRYHGDD